MINEGTINGSGPFRFVMSARQVEREYGIPRRKTLHSHSTRRPSMRDVIPRGFMPCTGTRDAAGRWHHKFSRSVVEYWLEHADRNKWREGVALVRAAQRRDARR